MTATSALKTESGDLYIWNTQIQLWLRPDYRMIVAGDYSGATHTSPATTTNGGLLVSPEEWV